MRPLFVTGSAIRPVYLLNSVDCLSNGALPRWLSKLQSLNVLHELTSKTAAAEN